MKDIKQLGNLVLTLKIEVKYRSKLLYNYLLKYE